MARKEGSTMAWSAPSDQVTRPHPPRHWEPEEPPHVVIWRGLEAISRQIDELAKRIEELVRR